MSYPYSSTDYTENLQRTYKLRQAQYKKEFDEVMERAVNGTATKEELRKYQIHPVHSEDELKDGLPSDGVFFPRVKKN